MSEPSGKSDHGVSGHEAPNQVVVGVDGSEDGLRAVGYAARAAQSLNADLLVVHAVDDSVVAGAWGVVYDPALLEESGREAAEQGRRRALDTGFDPERLRAEVLMGSPGAVLPRLSEQARLIVVGRRAMSGLERLFVGSTSVGVATAAHCPVIMVSAASHPEDGDRRGIVGVGIDGTPRCVDALEFGFAEAQRRGARLEVVHAFEVTSSFFTDERNRIEREQAQFKAATQGIGEIVRPLRDRYPGLEVDTLVVNNHPVKELNARSKDLDLLVVGVHGVGLPGFAPGATIRALMAHSECPIALIRHHSH